jgi:hypothetical protein
METYIKSDPRDTELHNVTTFVNTLSDSDKETLAQNILKGLGFFGIAYFGDEDIKQEFEVQFGDDDYVEELSKDDLINITDRCIFHEAQTYEFDANILADIIADYVNERK